MTDGNEGYGWTSYERTLWRNDEGGKCYIGHFCQGNDPLGYTKVTIRFWAHKPIIALRHIVNSGKHPAEFNDAVIN